MIILKFDIEKHIEINLAFNKVSVNEHDQFIFHYSKEICILVLLQMNIHTYTHACLFQ